MENSDDDHYPMDDKSSLQMALIPHLFFPRRLPAGESGRLKDQEQELLKILLNSVTEVSAKLPQDPLRCTKTMLKEWYQMHSSPQGIGLYLASGLRKLECGHSLALYIRKQNAGLMFSRKQDNHVVVSSFPASLKSEVVMAASVGSTMEFPTQSIQVTASNLLISQNLALRVQELNDQESSRAMPVFAKADGMFMQLRDVANPKYVTQWFTAALMDDSSMACAEFPRITKKIRDSVVWESHNCSPFRRSGLWMTAKVALQITLIEEVGETGGRFLYKILILHLLQRYCDTFASRVDADVALQMISKLARRMVKLRQMRDAHQREPAVNSMSGTLLPDLWKDISETIATVRSMCDSWWKSVITQDREAAQIAPIFVDQQLDVDQKLLSSGKYFFDVDADIDENANRSNYGGLQSPWKRHPRTEAFPSFSGFPFKVRNVSTAFLRDVEVWILHLDASRTSLQKTANFFVNMTTLTHDYLECAKKHYAHDPVGGSRMILVVLKLVRILDEIATESHQLLLQHQPGVDLGCVSCLLLPFREDMVLARELEDYFAARLKKADYPSLLHGVTNNEKSFAVWFASRSVAMERLRTELVALGDKRAKEKMEELKAAKERCIELQKKIDRCSHEYYTSYGEKLHYSSCTKCSLEATYNSQNVMVYERPLREDLNSQLAVVFELLIPEEIACLRDVLFLFRREVDLTMANNEKVNNFWKDTPQANPHFRGIQQYVHLGSTVASATQVRESRSGHPMSGISFVVHHAYKCEFNFTSQCPSDVDIQKFTTFRIEANSPYANLQWTMNGTNHTQNEVLAKQCTCNPSLSLLEFKEFGSLRAGHRLQLRNLYRALHRSTLTLKEPSVFLLIAQSIWQTEHRSTDDWCRDAFEDLRDPWFASEFLQLLDSVADVISDNWQDTNAMNAVIITTSRVLSFAEDGEKAFDCAISLLRKLRSIAFHWSKQILKLLQDMVSSPLDEIMKMRLKLVEVSICSALTFVIEPVYLQNVLCESNDIRDWFLALAYIKDNMRLTNKAETTFHENLFQRITSMALLIQQHLYSMSNKLTQSGLSAFVRQYWSDAELGTISDWHPQKPDSEVYYSRFTNSKNVTCLLELDILSGSFLVDGGPIGRLPAAITDHPDFQRIFESIQFDVSPAADGYARYVTSLKFHGSSYTFRLDKSSLNVVERRENGAEFHLFPPERLAQDLPEFLVKDFSHWWNRQEGYLEFRNIHFVDFIKSKPQYRLRLVTRRLKHLKTGRLFCDISSSTYQSLVRVMSRLELEKHVRVFVDPATGLAHIELPRMDLTFQVGPDNTLLCCEYRGFQVAPQQRAGFFIGLQHSLLLENLSSQKKIIIVPHGQLQIQEHRSQHQSVTINRTNLSTPRVFSFDVDPHLHSLKAGQSHSSWLYLALLFAATSAPLPDPFTEMTGTEMALTLLQKARCWSNGPYDSVARCTLDAISRLSPRRCFHPDHIRVMEVVQWPQGLPSMAAHDGFHFAASKLTTDSDRLDFLFPRASQPSPLSSPSLPSSPTTNKTLHRRAYWQHLSKYNEQGRLSPDWMGPTPWDRPYCSPASTDSVAINDTTMHNVRILSHLCHTWTAVYPSSELRGELKKFLITQEDLKGTTRNFHGFGAITSVTDYSWLRNSWLDLYVYARNVTSDSRQNEWAILLTILAFNGVCIEPLYLLHIVAVHPQFFAKIDPPKHEKYVSPNENNIRSHEVAEVLRSFATECTTIHRDDTRYEAQRKRQAHEDKVNQQVELLTQCVTRLWPRNNVTSRDLNIVDCVIDTSRAINKLSDLLMKWYNNMELTDFVNNVEEALQQVSMGRSWCLPVLRDITAVQKEQLPEGNCKTMDFDFRSLRQLQLKHGQNVDAEIIYNYGTVRVQKRPISSLLASNCTAAGPLQEHSKRNPNPRELCTSGPLKVVQCNIGHFIATKLTESWNENGRVTFRTEIEFLEGRTNSMWEEVKHAFVPSDLTLDEIQALRDSRLFPAVVPMTMLPMLCTKVQDPAWKNLHHLIGAFAVLLTRKQRAIRCEALAVLGDSTKVALQRELETEGYENWSPAEYPEWLIFQVEMDLMIRPVQVQVAQHMLDPPEGRSTVMQLNMGEGKTSVIVPLVSLSLSSGIGFCQVTVLRSLFQTNLQQLSFAIGGLLDRRVYTFPCHRDMAIGAEQIHQMFLVYQECMSKCGVVMMRPEHRLSFLLKGLEKSRSGDVEQATKLLQLQEWLDAHARNVLDESDEILNIRYQLVYTVGDQLSAAGGSLRWVVAQEVIGLFKKRLPEFWEQFGRSDKPLIEWADHQPGETFTVCRILNDECYPEIRRILANDCMDGRSSLVIPDFCTKNRQLLVEFVTQPDMDEAQHRQALMLLDENVRDTLLILRGILAHGVFVHCFKRRWRVQYGVNPDGPRRMAVPFRAKDVPAERSEFGHPDVAIFLSILSYYYSGLSDKDLEECFRLCGDLQNPEQEYQRWVDEIPKEKVCPSISRWTGVNLSDYLQRTQHLFPVLRRNVATINFWLGQVVFPKESKQFVGKLLCTPWDLCPDTTAYPTTGFSGTNESELLLPMTIKQQDLPQLQGTNGQVLKCLLLKENDAYRPLLANCTGRSLLGLLAESGLKLLLDVGALMLELNNKQVALEWLKLVPESDVDAAIYFDSGDHLVVLDRKGNRAQLAMSTYRERLDRCVIYLDDIHTRGTDLKIPSGTVGCVTLATGLTKDRIIQACMRMRLLGKGHSVCFWASQEADIAIRTIRSTDHVDSPVTSRDVMEWAIDNTRRVIQDGLLPWSTQGINYLRKKAAKTIFEGSAKTDEAFIELGKFCTENDILQLEALYGHTRKEALIPDIVLSETKKLKAVLGKQTAITETSRIVEHVRAFVPEVKRFSRFLEEEQERELEAELEEERQNVSIGSANPHVPQWSDELWEFICRGSYPPSIVVPLPLGLQHTTVWPDVEPMAWTAGIFATKNFIMTVKRECSSDTVGQFLRPVNWIVVKRHTGQVILVSPFEANILIPRLRNNRTAVLLMYAAQIQHGVPSLLTRVTMAVPSQDPALPHPLQKLHLVRPQLAVFSGCLYFESEEELLKYCHAVGYVPRPRSLRQQLAFDDGIMDKYGFVKYDDRANCDLSLSSFCFCKNPGKLIKSIAELRHGDFPSLCHVSLAVLNSKNPFAQ